MELHLNIQQTPRFGLATPSKHNDGAVVSHIEHTAERNGSHRQFRGNIRHGEIRHDRHHRRHRLTPFHHQSDPHPHDEQQEGRVALKKELPFIAPEKVASANGAIGSPIWIVIDNIVYDVTKFSNVHPGGEMPLKNFAGQSCSWQFHKIHSRKTLETYGEKLKIGRTGDVPNPYKEERPGISRQLWKSHHS
ncbi:hypothetical protein DTO166G4_9139 [Paecilomyces variotii]|nr:hypothetical protein DTO166G4_9139 [Paecilomyces variotii]KAJ9228639.1 hypothetical protein DTO169E5_9118 [Paecilomyces variotii]KAJ9248053.1 hypothetical protein DTO195F2_8938 [Paecilomyces variotii]KAJ9283340.1 hypothetical protein DTO021C3_9081 [Paecilomyces variotii]KAJ9353432.1 hypothetical protein DTO027B9_5359 [Paecilomyces variotii]